MVADEAADTPPTHPEAMAFSIAEPSISQTPSLEGPRSPKPCQGFYEVTEPRTRRHSPGLRHRWKTSVLSSYAYHHYQAFRLRYKLAAVRHRVGGGVEIELVPPRLIWVGKLGL